MLKNTCITVATGVFCTAVMCSEISAAPHKFLGVGSCSSSNCHGAQSPRKSVNIPQNEYITWIKHDKHAQAWEVLTKADAQVIGKHLGIAKPEEDKQCLVCHSTWSAETASDWQKFRQDGVGCEACHGAAEEWLRAHTASDATHNHNLEMGLSELTPPEKRAKLCLTCHFGDGTREVTHRLIGAGHPRLSFELDTFSAIEPWHWEVDDDYKKRKGDYLPARFWLSGQVENARAAVIKLGDASRSRRGLLPELSNFYCYSCHHSLASDDWKRRDYGGHPGELRLNLSSLVVLSQALIGSNQASGKDLWELLNRLSTAYGAGESEHALAEIKAVVETKLPATQEEKFYTAEHMRGMLKALLDYAASRTHLQYEEAEQFSMAYSALILSLWPQKSPYKAELDRIYQSLANAKSFQAEDFIREVQTLAKRI